jgi:hypothetical protein
MIALCALAVGGPANAQSSASGWKLVVRAVPNPIAAGRCTRLDFEVQDEQGYRRTELSSGAVIDPRQFRFDLRSTLLTWQNGSPASGYVCAAATATRATSTIGVQTPDGIAGSVDVITLAPGEVAVAVQYPPQAPLRPAGAPSTTKTALGTSATSQPTTPATSGGTASVAARPTTVVSTSTPTVARGGPSSGGGGTTSGTPSGTPPTQQNGSSTPSGYTPGTVGVKVSMVTIVGQYYVPPGVRATVPSVRIVGAYYTPGSVSVRANATSITGIYAPGVPTDSASSVRSRSP